MAPRPIFVLGRHRSGTTWLSNVLASLPEVYAPSHEAHRGVHESAFFSHLVRFCNHGRTSRDLAEIKDRFERSEFFRLTGLPQGPEIVGRGSAAYFRDVMDAAAARAGARYWLEKTPAHTLHAKFIAESFPDAILVAVVRDPRDVVASNVLGFGDAASAWHWFRQAAITAVYEKVIARNRVSIIRYESLVAAYEPTIRSLLARLGIESAAIPRSRFASNSSYDLRPPSRQWWQATAMAAGRGLVQTWPSSLVEAAVIRWRLARPGTLPPWFPPRGSDGPVGVGRDGSA